MKIGFLGNEHSNQLRRLYNGARASGWDARYVENKHSIVDDLDCLVVKGYRQDQRELAKRARRTGAVIIVIDAAFLNREEHYWQIGIDNLNWVTQTPCPKDRFDRLGHAICNTSNNRSYILICGQVPGDAQHPYMMPTDLLKHYNDTVSKIRSVTDRPIKFRPHPGYNQGVKCCPDDVELLSVCDDLMEQIKDAWCIVAYNSGCGNEALLKGVPVFTTSSEGYTPSYNELAFRDFEQLENPPLSTYDERLEYFSRLAYSQWKMAEFDHPDFWAFYNKQIRNIKCT